VACGQFHLATSGGQSSPGEQLELSLFEFGFGFGFDVRMWFKNQSSRHSLTIGN